MLSFTKICGLNCYDNFCIFYKNNLEIIRTIITMTSTFVKIIPSTFVCNICDYSTSNKKDYNKHLATIKHQKLTNNANNPPNNPLNKTPKSLNYTCNCGNSYKHRQSLYNHRMKCNKSEPINDEPITKEFVLQLIQQNKQLQEMLHEQHHKMYEIAKEGKYVTNNTTNTNNNNQFNLNFFLNEQCKDALNLTDFIDSLNVKIKDLEYTSINGYAEGISNIFLNGLQKSSINKRPIHCSDSKREVLYIKDNGIWQKEDAEKSKLTNAIKIIGNKNIKQISEWQKTYPEYNNPKSKQNDKYLKIVMNSMSGSTKEEADTNYEKIIRNIAKKVIINKNM